MLTIRPVPVAYAEALRVVRNVERRRRLRFVSALLIAYVAGVALGLLWRQLAREDGTE